MTATVTHVQRPSMAICTVVASYHKQTHQLHRLPAVGGSQHHTLTNVLSFCISTSKVTIMLVLTSGQTKTRQQE
jgi:hypothetical protein